MLGWFPLYPLKCTKCKYEGTRLYCDNDIVDIICQCGGNNKGVTVNCLDSTAWYWNVDQKEGKFSVSNQNRNAANAYPLKRADRLIFLSETFITREWETAMSHTKTAPVISNNNNNSPIDTRRLDEADKRIVALQNEVHKLSNELETRLDLRLVALQNKVRELSDKLEKQIIITYEDISKMQRKLFRNELMCVICQTSQIDTVVECGHVYCSECVQSIAKCAFCRKEVDVTTIKKIYF